MTDDKHAQIGIRCGCGHLNIRTLPYNPHKVDNCEFCDCANPGLYCAGYEAIPERTAERETGWLIEENASGYIHWIALAEDEWPKTKVIALRDIEISTYRPPVVRVKDAGKALRFARREDAEAFIKLFDRFLLLAVATEHEWANPIEHGAHLQDESE